MSENVKKIADWLKTYNQKYDFRYVIMYHAAGKDAPILEKGLLAGVSGRKNFSMSENGYVYLAVTPQMAKMFGDMAYNGNFVVYEVIVPVGNLLPDKNRLRHTLPEGMKGGGLAQSLVFAGSARVKGNIERWQIKACTEKATLMERLEQKKQEAAKQQLNAAKKRKDCERG